MSSSQVYVFAYGSNLCVPRMKQRAPSAVLVVRGFVAQRRLQFHKRGKDGSGKADAARTDALDARVWGVVYRICASEKPALDACESLGVGYDEVEVEVQHDNGRTTARMYEARFAAIESGLQPFAWYRDFLLHGAVHHDLPEHYIEYLMTFATIADPDLDRRRRNRRIIASHLESEAEQHE